MRKLTTEEFIEKAKIKHGDKYDYSLVEYQGAGIKVIINCKAHGDFLQLPSNHTSGQGCPECGGSKNSSTDRFIKIAKLKHGSLYDYSKVKYVRAHDPVEIICKRHGVFMQTPTSHTSKGAGCPSCNGGVAIDSNLFIEKSKSVHGDRYDYSKVDYINNTTKVEIICRVHGMFLQAPISHTAGSGCPECNKLGGGKIRTTGTFIHMAKSVHGDKYDYSLSSYVSAKVKVIIICPEHGEFSQIADTHLSGKGCAKCSGNVSLSKDEFVMKAKLIHGEKFDYSSVDYQSRKGKVRILCKTHGSFLQSASDHLSGRGCQRCAKGGYKEQLDGSLYVLRSACGSYLKIGISNFIKNRVVGLKSSTPFDFNIIERFDSDGSSVKCMESKFHKIFDNAGFKGFDGATEWFHYDSEKLEQLKNYGESINEN